MVHSLTKDDRLTIRRAVSLARQFRAFDPGRLASVTLPVDRAVQRDGIIHRAGEAGFEPARRQGWEQVLLPRQPDASKAVAKLLSRPSRQPARPPASAPAQPRAVTDPGKVSVTVRNGTARQGLAARVAAGLRRLGFKAGNGGNAGPAGTTTLRHAPDKDAAATLAGALKAGSPVKRATQPGLAAGTVVLVLGSDFRGLASRAAVTKPPATRPPKPTPATRDLPAWDPRPC